MAKKTGMMLDEKAFGMSAGAVFAAAALLMGGGMGMYSWGMMQWGMMSYAGPFGVILWAAEAGIIGAALGYAFAWIYNRTRA
ncbi:MAG TPA: hypothetical protein VI979_01565 [archaeon]|nr:hypothetical protein [archaeon]